MFWIKYDKDDKKTWPESDKSVWVCLELENGHRSHECMYMTVPNGSNDKPIWFSSYFSCNDDVIVAWIPLLKYHDSSEYKLRNVEDFHLFHGVVDR